MRPTRGVWAIGWMVLAAMGFARFAAGQDAESDRAQALLKKAVAEYEVKKYSQAQQTLLKVDPARLTSAQSKQHREYLANVRDAIRQQAAGQSDYDQAKAALKANDLEKAARLFEKVGGNEFVPDDVRDDARQQQALVSKRIDAQKASQAATQPPRPVRRPTVTVPTTRPATEARAPTTRPAEVRTALDDVRAQELQMRIERAKTFIELGNRALDSVEIDKAIGYFKQAVEAAPEYEPARIGLARAESLTGQARGLSAISELERIRGIRIGEVEGEYAQTMRRAREVLHVAKSTEDFAAAGERVNHARTLLTVNKSLFTDTEYRARLEETDGLVKLIDTRQQAWREEHLRQQADEIRRREEERKEEARRQLAEKLGTLHQRAVALEKDHKYPQAVEVLQTMRDLDPEDAWASETHERLGRFVLLLQDKDAAKVSIEEEAKQIVGVREAAIPWYELLRYGKDWPAISESRKRFAVGEAGDTPANRAVRKKLLQTHRKFEFAAVPLEQVIDFMREVSNCSIHVKWTALEQAGVNKDTAVNVKVTDVTIKKALELVLDDVGGAGGLNALDYVIDDGVITISTKEDLAKKVVTAVYDIRDLIFYVPMFEGPRIDLTAIGNNATGNNATGGTGLFGNVSNNVSGNNAGENQVSREQLVSNILDLIRATIAPESWGQGVGTGSVRELSGELVVTQTPANHEALGKLLEQLREYKALQINVEARFIQVSTGFLNHIGIDLDFYFNIGTRLKPVDDGTGGWLVDPLTGARIVDGSPGQYLNQWRRRTAISNNWTPGGVRQSSFDFAGPQQTAVPGSVGGAVTGSALSVAGTYLDDIQVDFLINATQANQNTRMLTAPRLTLFNSQRAYVTVATQQAYVSSVEPEVVENVAAFRPIIGTVSTGTTLDVEGVVTADRKYVNMTIRPQVSTINGFTEYQGAVDANGNVIPGSGQLQLPNVTVQQVECTVSVPDGGTLLLGGQRLAGEVEREMGVPILSKIPVIDRAFTNRSITRDEQTLLILVKPKIIIHKEYEEAEFPP